MCFNTCIMLLGPVVYVTVSSDFFETKRIVVRSRSVYEHLLAERKLSVLVVQFNGEQYVDTR